MCASEILQQKPCRPVFSAPSRDGEVSGSGAAEWRHTGCGADDLNSGLLLLRGLEVFTGLDEAASIRPSGGAYPLWLDD